MGISLGSLSGKADPAVLDALRQLADAVNRLEPLLSRPVVSAAPAAAIDPEARAAARMMQQQIQAIKQQLGPLENPPPPPAGVAGEPNVPPTDRLPLYDGSAIVAQVFADHPEFIPTSCQEAEGGTWDLMDAIVDALRAVDPRFGYNGKRGNPSDPSEDAIAYDYGAVPGGEGSTSVYIIDVIAGHCGPTPSAAWQDVTVFAPGVWISRGRF